jgi:hypothetical protein
MHLLGAAKCVVASCVFVTIHILHVGHAVQQRESKAVDGVFALLGPPHEDGPLTILITLPHCHGSLGLSLSQACPTPAH